MPIKKLFKVLFLLFFILGTVGVIYYFNLANRHKAIVKTSILHFFNLVDSDWETTVSNNFYTLESPALLIDDIYKSMEAPKVYDYFTLDPEKSDLLWLTGFKVSAIHPKNKSEISNDFICHMNIDYIEQEHYGRWNLLHRVNRQYPRLISLSHGIESTKFPDGYGYPLFSDEKIFINTQALNHNIADSIFQIKHDISIQYSKQNENIKPLMPKTIFMMLPFDIENPYDNNSGDIENSCIPMETKNHTYFDKNGQALSGHWKIFKGQHTFTCNVTDQLAIKDSVRLHKIVPHLHPFAEQFILKDRTTNTTIYNCEVTNHSNKIGLSSTPDFTSVNGVYMYSDHDYELILKTNNTTELSQDMMASMFMFFYDAEMDSKIKAYVNEN